VSRVRLLIVGGSDAGISAGLAARDHDPTAEVTLFVADAYPNYSICGIPYHVSGEVPHLRNLAHRTASDLEAAGLRLNLGQRVTGIDPAAHAIRVGETTHEYDKLVIATGAVPAVPPINGLDRLGPADGVHLLHSIGDMLDLQHTLHERQARTAIIVGAGYIGLEMTEALTTRGLQVTLLEQLDQVMPTIDPQLAAHLHRHLTEHGVAVHTGTKVHAICRDQHRLTVETDSGAHTADLVLVVTGVRPDTTLAAGAGITLGHRETITVDRQMRTNQADIYAAGDCVRTYHRLLDHYVYLPLGSTAHKQGRIAGLNATGGNTVFAGSLGTQAVKVFDLVAAGTGLRDTTARQAGYQPVTVEAVADDHKAYYPGPPPSGSGSPATAPPAASSARNCSATTAPK
jgi:NADPH-dependent 2,4-dienoyl-CoA reductase/sulfur reductase-like enzyme